MGQEDGRDDEIAALMQAEGVDSAKIADQVAKISGKVVEPKKEDDKPPEQKPDETKPPEKKPEDIKKEVPDPEMIKAGVLREMWGDQFKTIEDFKKANIPAQLQELEPLRQKIKDLETQIGKKPKHSFVNDDLAKFNEFVRETGISNYEVFRKLNSVDIANMDDMDALIWNRISEDPDLVADIPRVRKNFERKFDVDKAKIEAGDLTQEEYDDNLFNMRTEARNAKKKLQEIKEKIKMPEPPKEEPEAGKETKWTPEVEAKQKTDWNVVNVEMYNHFSKMPIYLKGVKDPKEPIANFELPEEAKSKILGHALDYIVSNQLEVNKSNMESVAKAMYSDIRDSYFDDIVHTVFERGRTITEKEYLEKYHNPSKTPADTPPGGSEEVTDEVKLKAAYDAEMTR